MECGRLLAVEVSRALSFVPAQELGQAWKAMVQYFVHHHDETERLEMIRVLDALYNIAVGPLTKQSVQWLQFISPTCHAPQQLAPTAGIPMLPTVVPGTVLLLEPAQADTLLDMWQRRGPGAPGTVSDLPCTPETCPHFLMPWTLAVRILILDTSLHADASGKPSAGDASSHAPCTAAWVQRLRDREGVSMLVVRDTRNAMLGVCNQEMMSVWHRLMHIAHDLTLIVPSCATDLTPADIWLCLCTRPRALRRAWDIIGGWYWTSYLSGTFPCSHIGLTAT